MFQVAWSACQCVCVSSICG